MAILGDVVNYEREAVLLAQTKHHLRRLRNMGALTYRRIHVMPVMRSGRNGRKFATPNTDMAGMPDWMIFLREGKTLHVELKTAKGRQTPHQAAWQEELTRLGHDYYVIRSMDAFLEMLAYHGIARY